MIIGISGKIGTGKSHVVKYLKRKLKFEVIDAEKIKHELIEEPNIKEKLLDKLGMKILHPNGTIHRKKLTLRCAKDTNKLKYLSENLDLLIGEKIKQIVKDDDDNYIIESTQPDKQSITSLFDVSVLITTSKRIAYTRLLRKYPKKVIDNLWRWQKNTRAYDYIIENKTSIKDLKDDINELISEMFKNQKK
ncbi:dephospho-CoA kinase [Candidatus Dojkabacteria bacterium]|nr:dephospho-CoA kinase [Candidatus Dojkabacteria bacterium]